MSRAVRVLFVSRHAGAIEWAQSQGVVVDERIEHLDTQVIQVGDTVIGSLPVNLAAQVCERGGHYYHLSLNVPQAWRGRELSADDMQRFQARLEEYTVQKI